MTTFTKEQLIEIIKRNITVMDRYPDLVTAQMDLEVYKIALASLEAEPVAYIFKHPAGKLFWALTDESNKEQPDVIPVYADSPAPVVPDEIDVNDVPRAVTYFKTHRDCYADGWNACHAAMLQGSQPVSQTYKFPVNTPCQDAPAHIWLQTAGVWPEDGELSELTWCSHNQHHDDTLYVRADLVNGNSQVTPDGWISCSERMPAQDDWILIYSKHGEYMAGQVQGEYVELSDGTLSWLGNALFWMPLPEPPQEVNRG
ncbi:TPA: hypothetical protein GE417_13415 [Escherichia coli]|uniref:DUF551 domain-containing protein n=2 Tax=Escherichia coli TaxID=562 RepID=UPI00174F9C21|nr:DUF551 domain-containing protein [Escherichia coli]EFN2059166.1 DUF551 domain-containing protein [Escherichia coli]ELK7701466.1 DUF551 domain-containing protein [Escherichia coli]MBL4070751.1 DUF551 domain-containing protein [Escherichia coli]HAH0222421.1 hypothetical protein [Escherichia coli]HAH4724299.1 DUF551 domain-containing protein [Escherichia coli]